MPWMGIPSIGILDHFPNPASLGYATGLIENGHSIPSFQMEAEMVVSGVQVVV